MALPIPHPSPPSPPSCLSSNLAGRRAPLHTLSSPRSHPRCSVLASSAPQLLRIPRKHPQTFPIRTGAAPGLGTPDTRPHLLFSS